MLEAAIEKMVSKKVFFYIPGEDIFVALKVDQKNSSFQLSDFCIIRYLMCENKAFPKL